MIPRKPSNGTLHNFQEILVIAIAAMLGLRYGRRHRLLGTCQGRLAAPVSGAQERHPV